MNPKSDSPEGVVYFDRSDEIPVTEAEIFLNLFSRGYLWLAKYARLFKSVCSIEKKRHSECEGTGFFVVNNKHLVVTYLIRNFE